MPRLAVPSPRVLVALAVALLCLACAPVARAADRERIAAFLEVTGFDVALDSIALAPPSAPRMLGLEPDEFGADWGRLAAEVFEPEILRGLALEILEQTLDAEDLAHAAEFYAGDLGQRLVAVENASHMVEDDAAKQEAGAALIAEMVAAGDERLALLKRMQAAIGGVETSVYALQEIQIRFLLAAAGAGVIELRMDPGELRAAIEEREGVMRRALQQSALAGAAYTYEGFTPAELEDYAEALEQPRMRRVYELLNAVQFEIMANRFEELARRMSELHPQEDI